MQSSKVSK